MIGLGLYFGLRRDGADPRPAPSTTGSASSNTPASSASTTPVGSVSAATTVAATTAPLPVSAEPTSSSGPPSRAKTDSDVAAAVEALRQRAKKECWEPHKADKGMPLKLKFVYSGSFDAKGTEVARGISDDRVAYSPKVSECIRQLPMDLKITGTGQYENVNLDFEVP